ncbi:MAG: hypothetical protein WCP86_00155 [bacterium]
MKRLTLRMIVVTATLLVGTVFAGLDRQEPQLRLELDLVDGSHIVGTPSLASVPVQTSYAKMDIQMKQILTIKIDDNRETASIALRNGDRLKGVINLEPIHLETVFGTVKIGIEQISGLRTILTGSWITPMGGNVIMEDGAITLSGPGNGDAENAIAILKKAMPRTCRITGELKRTGPYSGFVIGYNLEARTFLGVYSEYNKGASSVYSHNGLSRTDLSAPGTVALVFPPADTYAKFSIDITPKKVTFRIENSKLTMDVPPEVTGDRFGIEVYHGSTMQIRNLVIDGEYVAR